MKIIKNHNIGIVMYHYIRPIKKSLYPNLKGLEFNNFKKQINYFKNKYNVLNFDDFLEILKTKKIPKKPCIILTFDDGYIDHYNYAFPYLVEKKISGIFYPPINVIKKSSALDVNKVHFILEKQKDRNDILLKINGFLKKKIGKQISDFDFSKINFSSRYDNKKTVLIKRLLQFYLEKSLREKLINYLFKFYVGIDEKEFCKNLYLTKENIIEMSKFNMKFGSHGSNHYWWNTLSKLNQEKELLESRSYYKKININIENFSVCYPYGSFDLNTLKLMKKHKISFALTTKVGSINKKNISNKFILPRYDTNDFI